MVAWLVLLGVLLVPSAAFLLWSWRSSRNDMALMRATETTPAAHVAKLPPGSLVEVKGRLRCASPVTGELSNAACAHFVSTVERDYEFFEYDSHRKTSCCKRKTEIVKTTTLFAPFEIEDASGRARVSPESGDHRRHRGGRPRGRSPACGGGRERDADRARRHQQHQSHALLPLQGNALAGRRRHLCARRGWRGPLHRCASARRQGAALPHQRQLRGSARGGARQQEPSGCSGSARSAWPARWFASARRLGWRATVSIGRHRRRASCKTRAGGNKTVGLGTKQDYIASS